MTKLLRRTLLISSTALMAITFIPLLGSILPETMAALVASEAQARNGDSGSDSDGDSDGDSSGSDSDSDSDGDSSGSDSDGDRGGDDSGRDSESDRNDSDDDSSSRNRSGSDDDSDDSGRRGRGSDDDDDDDSSDDDNDDDDNGRRRDDRDRVRVSVNDSQLQGLLNGSMVAVDQNGKRLRFEFEEEHGRTEIKVRAPEGTLSSVTVVPAP